MKSYDHPELEQLKIHESCTDAKLDVVWKLIKLCSIIVLLCSKSLNFDKNYRMIGQKMILNNSKEAWEYQKSAPWRVSHWQHLFLVRGFNIREDTHRFL